MDSTASERRKVLLDELRTLTEQQCAALETGTFLPMTKEQSDSFEERADRISELWSSLKIV
jgi:hypothetical protein